MIHRAEHYILATGGKDVKRLRLLHEVYGPGTEALFHRVGLRDGLRIAEIGCGSGNTACWVAQHVAPNGSVVAIDISSDQVEQARQQAQRRNVRNIEFHVADAYSPRLPEGSFDLVYCRLVLMHLTRPAAALAAMRGLVRPGGVVVCEEMDLGCWLRPSGGRHDPFLRAEHRPGRAAGRELLPGPSLHRLFRAAGFAHPEVGANFTLALRGEQKRLLGMTFAEFAPELVQEGLASQAEVDRVAAGLMALADDETVLFGFPLVAQVWAVR